MDGAGLSSRHAIYIGHPDADNYSKHLLTLLAQRRELQTEELRRLLSDAVASAAASPAEAMGPEGYTAGGSTPNAAITLPPSLFSGAASAASIDRERRELHAEVSLGLESRFQPTLAESIRAAVEGGGKPYAGLPSELTAMSWHFRARAAESVVEQRALLRHTAALRRQHFGHVVGRSLPADVHRQRALRRQMGDHAGSAWQGELRPCACERELALARECMQAMQLAETDAAARLGRMTALRTRDDSDWWAALHWAASRLPPGRAAERFFDRLRVLPLSHHHRFPIYEQVSGCALHRDQHATATGLRVPPRVVTTNSESLQHLEQLSRGFDPGDLLPVAAQVSSMSMESLPMTVLTENSARQHRAAYEARKMLPRVLARHRRRWPGAAVLSVGPVQHSEGGGGEAAATAAPAAVGTESLPDVVEAIEPFPDDPACSSRDQVYVVQVMHEQLAALVPSMEGDESSGYQAMLRTMPLEVDEVLKAENDFLNECNPSLVHDRLRSLAEQHVDRWSPFANEEPAVRMTLSLSNAPWTSEHLQDKTVEAMVVLRFLTTKRNKIRVLHYLNALVSLQLQLLRDERDEEAIAQPLPTAAAKDFTCPVAYANGSAGAGGSGGAATGAGTAGGATNGAGTSNGTSGSATAAAPDAEYDIWLDDPEAGVSVRDADGKWILYEFAVEQFKSLESELLRVATYHLEVYAAQVHAGSGGGGAGGPGASGGGGSGASTRESAAATAQAIDTIHMVDKLTVLADLWECEAQYCAARHKTLLGYYQAYRHATSWGLSDIWGGCTPDVVPFTGSAATTTPGAATAAAAAVAAAMAAASGAAGGVDGSAGAWQRVAANSPQPQLLGARRQLRRELIDLTFRRPDLAHEDGYFAERYHSGTLSLELEATLVGQLCGLAARNERQTLAASYTSAVAAASAVALLGIGGGMSGGGPSAATVASGSAEALWKPGYHPGIVYGGVINVGQRGLLQEGATLSSVGAAAAALPTHLRAAAAALANLHQLRHHVELADLRRVVLQYGVTEMAVLLQEEAYRAHAPVERPPKDSIYDSNRGRRDLPSDAPLLRGNWLVTSHVADNVEVLRATAVEAGVEPKGALEVFLNKETLIRNLYRGEMLWLVYVVQARALGRRIQHSEMHGIDWGQLDAVGNALKAEMLTEIIQQVEPEDIAPPGAEGPGVPDEGDIKLQMAGGGKARSGGGTGGGGSRRGQGGGDSGDSGDEDRSDGDDDNVNGYGAGRAAADEEVVEEDEMDEDEAAEAAAQAAAAEASGSRLLMVAVGSSGLLGGVWRSPPLALAEFSTSPAELLNPHSLAGLRAMLRPGDMANSCLAVAVRAQVLRSVALEVSIRHNQILLDSIIRKLDRRRRVLLWRAAAMEGVTDSEAMDVVVGAPPGAYAPANFPLSSTSVFAAGVQRSGRGTSGGSEDTAVATQRRGGSGGAGARVVPPLLRNPPGDRFEEYNSKRRSSSAARAWMRSVRAKPSSSSPVGGSRSSRHSPSRMHPLMEALDDTDLEDLRQRRRALTAAAGALYLDINEIKMRLRVQARRSYVQGLLRAKGSGGGPDAEALVRAETEAAYTAAFLTELLPAASRTHMAAVVRELAVLVLGSTGGYGLDWGLRYDSDGQLLGAKEDRGPLFSGPEGQAALRAAVIEYGPMWQSIMFPLADKKNDPDPMDWSPAAPAVGLPYAIGFMKIPSSGVSSRSASPAPGAAPAVAASSGPASVGVTAAAASGPSSCLVRLETLWGLPGQWEVLHGAAVHYPPGSVGLSALEKGVVVASLVVEVVRHFLFVSSLLAPSSTLALGGDVCGQSSALAAMTRAGIPQAHPVSYSAAHNATGAAMYRQTEMRMVASGASLLPGALLAADLVKLQARLQYLHRPQGVRASTSPSSLSLQPSPTQPADDVIAALRREVGVLAAQRVLAAARVRDSLLTAGGPGGVGIALANKKRSWYLTASLEHLLARSAARITTPMEDCSSAPAAPPGPSLPLPASFALRLPDPDRLALHNEAVRIASALERWLAECRVPAATSPHDALALQEYCLAGMWAHDRLRDALCWRALLMEAPESFPFTPPHVGTFLRRYHSSAPPLCQCLCPPPATVEALQAIYGSKILGQAKSMVSAAESYVATRATSRSAGHVEEEPFTADGGTGGRDGEGRPAWLASSPAWGSPEARYIEASVAACKQHLDLQAVQVALLRLHQDCDKLAGLRSLVVGVRAPSAATSLSGAATSPNPSANGGLASAPALIPLAAATSDMLHPHALPASAIATFARKLAARQRRSGPAGDIVEINLDEALRWLADTIIQITASSRGAAAAGAAAAERERAGLHGLVGSLEEAVGGLAADTDTFMRQHEIKVETQVVDRAMSLLLELSQARRAALRNSDDARRALEIAYAAAQKQYVSHIDELNNQLIVARTNSSIMRSELQKAALEALIEVRREMLNRAFASGTMKMSEELGKTMALERQMEEQQTEILDLQRSISKVQSWFKMRSSTLVTACMKEVAAARARAEALEAELWEVRERQEVAVEQLSTQLRATQADLEAVAAGAARNASDLRHALTSNKRLLKWKVTTAPRIEALKTKMAQITRNREAWQEWVNSKQGLMQQLGSQLIAINRHKHLHISVPGTSGGLMSSAGGGGGLGSGGQGTPLRKRSSTGSASGGERSGGGSGRMGSGSGGSATVGADLELEAIRQEWEPERRQMQQEIARLKADLLTERMVKNDVFERLLKLERHYVAAAGQVAPPGTSTEVQAAAASASGGAGSGGGGGTGGTGGTGNFLFGRSSMSPMQLDILSRRYEELRASHLVVREENTALRRTLAALRTIAPDLVTSLEFPLMLHQQASTGGPAGGAAGTLGGAAIGGIGGTPVVAAHGAAVVPDLRGTAAPGLLEPASSSSPPLAGTLRPGTAGRLRSIGGVVGSRLTANGGGAADAGGGGGGSGGGGGGSSTVVGGSLRRGVGASGARPPSAATYALRAGFGPHLSPGERPISARPRAGGGSGGSGGLTSSGGGGGGGAVLDGHTVVAVTSRLPSTAPPIPGSPSELGLGKGILTPKLASSSVALAAVSDVAVSPAPMDAGGGPRPVSARRS